MHLVDTTLFFSPTSGGVKRYLTAKHHWLKGHTTHRHTIVVPGERSRFLPMTSRPLLACGCPARSITGYRCRLAPGAQHSTRSNRI